MSERSPKHSASLRAGRYPQRANRGNIIAPPSYSSPFHTAVAR